MEAEAYLRGEAAEVERALERVLARWETRLPAPVAGAVRHGVTGGGKRVRPVLCVTAYRAAGGGPAGPSGGEEDGLPDAAYDVAVSLELIHAYSLMHDDLPCMDDAELRRGRPATHRAHGVGNTILAGAALIPLSVGTAYRGALELGRGEEGARQVASELSGAAGVGGMVGGQALDLLAEGRALGADELQRLHALKTGALLTASLRMGALAAGARAPVVEALGEYGTRVGLAFQIADDVLDRTATAEALGKKPSDADRDKSTYVALYGLEGARERARAEVEGAVDALDRGGIDSPPLRLLAAWIVERKR